MIGAIEILMIAVIIGIIYGRDAIDKTWRKKPNEGVVESVSIDALDYYSEDPKRFIKLAVLVVSILGFLGLLIYWVVTKTDLAKMLDIG